MYHISQWIYNGQGRDADFVLMELEIWVEYKKKHL